jgi:hypothetical protein
MDRALRPSLNEADDDDLQSGTSVRATGSEEGCRNREVRCRRANRKRGVNGSLAASSGYWFEVCLMVRVWDGSCRGRGVQY